jgi:arylsulfatase A-like enzyme
MDAHRPYCPPPEALGKLGRADISLKKMFKLKNIWLRKDLSTKRLMNYRKDFVALYDACISFIDSQLGRLFDALSSSGSLGSTLIVLTADHGEAFLERGERDHHPVLVTQELINVPLFIRLPAGQQLVEKVGLPFSHIDLLPTMLDMAGLACPPAFTGKSRWPALKHGKPWQEPAITEMVYGYDLNPKGRFNPAGFRLLAATDDRYKLVINFATGAEELFDLDADPEELDGLPLSANPPASQKLLRALKSHLERSFHSRYSKPEIEMRMGKIKELFLHYNKR